MKFRFNQIRYYKTLNVSDILHNIVDDIGLSDDFVLEHIKAQWTEAVGDIIATHSQPYKIKDNALYVTVDHPIYANEIEISQSLIMEKISKKCGTILFKKIKCSINKGGRKRGNNVYSHR